jgi:predicted TIM-barrel fold metal-dependent hydrolase
MTAEWKSDAIDSHVHIWTDDFTRYPLDSGFKISDLAVPRFLPEDVLSHAQANGVGRILLIQMSYYGFDNSLLLDIIRLDSAHFRGMAVIDENGEDLAFVMRQMRAAGVRGFRVVALDPAIGLMERPGLRKLLARAGEEQMVIGFLTAPELLKDLLDVAVRFPDTTIVVDHMARIGMNGPITPEQVDLLCRLAHHPKTYVKISAFYALGSKKPPHDDLAPAIRRLYDSFGPSRLMWGSDAPFQTIHGSYKDSLDLIRFRLPFLSDHDKNLMLREAAAGLFFS